MKNAKLSKDFILSELTFSDDYQNVEIFKAHEFPVYLAAPEMFSALEAWENALKSEGMMVPYFLQSALRKARGEK